MHDANTHQEDAEESRARYHSTHSEANTKDRHHTRGHPRLLRGARGDVATLRTLRRASEKPERADEVCEEPGRSRGTVLVSARGPGRGAGNEHDLAQASEAQRAPAASVPRCPAGGWTGVAGGGDGRALGDERVPPPARTLLWAQASLRPRPVFAADPGVAAKRPPRRPPAPRLTPPSWARKATVPSVPLSGGLPVSVPWGRPAFSSVTFWSVAALAET